MSDLYFAPFIDDGDLRPVPLGQLGEPASLYLLEEWVPEQLLTLLGQFTVRELASTSPRLTASRLARKARVDLTQVKQFLAGGPARVTVVEAILEPLGFCLGFAFESATFIQPPDRLAIKATNLTQGVTP